MTSGEKYAQEIEHSVIASRYPGETIAILATCSFEWHNPVAVALVDRGAAVDIALFGSDGYTGLRAANLIRDRIKMLRLEIEAGERLLAAFDQSSGEDR